ARGAGRSRSRGARGGPSGRLPAPGPPFYHEPSAGPHSPSRSGKAYLMAEAREPRNPFYFLLLLTSLLFVVTALAYAIIPTLEEKARDAGEPPPASSFRESLRYDGWLWLLYQVGAMLVFGLLSMGLDRLRRLQKERAEATIPPAGEAAPD